MPKAHAKMHFEKFCNLDFGIATKDEWLQLMHNLLKFERILLLTSWVGFVSSYLFNFEVVYKFIYPKE